MKAGFTLIELLVVVLIIGILAAVALPQYQVAVAKSQYVQLIALADAYKKSEERFFLANGQYTFDFTELDLDIPSGWKLSENHRSISNGNKWCITNDGSGGGSVLTLYCQNLNNAYYLPYEGKRLCFAGTDIGHKVCKSLGGIYSSTLSSGTYYSLP